MNKTAVLGLLTVLAAVSGILYLLHQHKSTPTPNETAIYDSWVHWRNRHLKSYSTEEEHLRYQIYRSNLLKIQQHNQEALAGKHSFTLDVNEFADLTNAEFRSIYTGVHVPKTKKNVKELSTKSLDSEVDWRNKGVVTDVKNQGQCGSCWAFSTTGSLEGLHALKKGSLLSFSEQQLVDCSTSYGNQGCNGGLMDLGFEYAKDHGIELEKAYPYTGEDGTCSAKAQQTVFTISGHADVPQNQTSQLKAAVSSGPVSVAIEADGFWFQFYSGGVFDSSCGTALDHGVLVVGYGSDSGKNYWTVKNSWGGSWGENGYIRIADNGDGPGLCGIQMEASYPLA